jgi:hypothetical protein
VLKPRIVAAAVCRSGASGDSEPNERDLLPAKTHHDLVRISRSQHRDMGRTSRDGREAERRAVKTLRAREIRHDSADAQDPLRPHLPRRAAMPSATRSALAMIVSVGFTAPMEGKKLASTT